MAGTFYSSDVVYNTFGVSAVVSETQCLLSFVFASIWIMLRGADASLVFSVLYV